MKPNDFDDPAAAAEVVFELLIDHLCVAGFDGYWKRLNPSWTRTLGWTTQELMSRPLIEFVHPDDREATLAAREGLKVGEPLLSLTNRYRHKDGSYRWFEWRSVSDMERRLVYAVARDVTEEHEIRYALRESNEGLTATLDSMADGVIATDADGAVIRMNPVAEALTGWRAADARGMPLGEVFEIVRADTRDRAPAIVERSLPEGLASEGAEHILLIARDGSERPIAFSRAPMRDGDGQVSGAVIVFRDMTADYRARQEQERLQRQLMFADRMASVGTLAAGVAHEINNPLAYVIANLDILAGELERAEPAALATRTAEWLTLIREAGQGADRIRRIVGSLKTYSRAGEERRAVIELEPVLELSISMTLNEIRHRARLVKDYGPTPPVEADDSRLGQVFINLLVNAAQAIGDGEGDTDEIAVLSWTDASGRAVVEVRDTGPGIAADVLDRVFDPFVTTKPIGVGTGLGLAICHNIVTGLGGQISAANRPEGGAAFRVTLPAAPRSRAATPAPVAPASPAGPRRGAVLVVDDERAVGRALERLLRDHEVTVVTSGADALALLDAGASFDVILSDLMMPGMSGMELYEHVARRGDGWAERMIFMTGGAFSAAANTFLDRVPNPRLDKPFDTAALRALIASRVQPD